MRCSCAGDPTPFLTFDLGGEAILVRMVDGNPQCLVDPKSPRKKPECEKAPAARRRLLQGASRRTLTCGDPILGPGGGYDDPNSWCTKAKVFLIEGEQRN